MSECVKATESLFRGCNLSMNPTRGRGWESQNGDVNAGCAPVPSTTTFCRQPSESSLLTAPQDAVRGGLGLGLWSHTGLLQLCDHE